MSTERNNKEQLSEHYSFNTSDYLTAAIIRGDSIALKNGRVLGSIDLMYCLLSKEGRASSEIKAFCGENFSKFLDLLEKKTSEKDPANIVGEISIPTWKQTISFDQSFEKVVKKTIELKGSNIIWQTDDILTAELLDENSVIQAILSEIEKSSPILPVIKEIMNNTKFEETGNNSLLATHYQESKKIKSKKENSRNLVTINQTDVIKDLMFFVNKEKQLGKYETSCVEDLIEALENQNIIPIVGESRLDAELLLSNLALQLSQVKTDIFPYKKVFIIEQSFLELSPQDAISAAAGLSKDGGILFLPNIDRYLDLKQIQGFSLTALANKFKLVTYFDNKEWNEIYTKGVFEGLKPIKLSRPDPEEVQRMLLSVKPLLQYRIINGGFKLEITDEAIKEAVRLADRNYRNLPLVEGAEALIKRAATLIKMKAAGIHSTGVENDLKIDSNDIAKALEGLTGIEPVSSDNSRFLKMEDEIKTKVVGQDEAIKEISDIIKTYKAGIKDPKRPIGTFMFMGPSGVGKTELAKSLAWFLFGNENKVVRLDMSEYQEQHAVARMIGAPPGYVGYEEGGQLTEAIKKDPYSIIVFDEVEKAHPEVLNSLLQIMDDGRLTDGKGETVDFKNTVIIMTGNVGSKAFGYTANSNREEIVEDVNQEIKSSFKPEFLNRIDRVLIFNNLKSEDILKIVDIQINDLNRLLKEQDLSLEATDEAKKFLADKGFSPEYGARPLKRLIQSVITTPLSEKILKNEIANGRKVKIELKNNKLEISSE